MSADDGPVRGTSNTGRVQRKESGCLVYKPYDEVPQLDDTVGVPHTDTIESTLTDFYQITMVYGYWKAKKHEEKSVFDLYFRKCPFKGEFTILGGIDEAIRFLNTFTFNEKQIKYLRTQLPNAEEEFFAYLGGLDTSEVQVYAIAEGTVVFPNVPLLRVEGPLAVCQLLETPLLNLINFPSLVATNACRHRLAAGKGKRCLEFGCRRAQGPDGAMSAARYAYMGGFHGTSNVRAGHLFGIPIVGTHAHAFVTSFQSLSDLGERKALGGCADFVSLCVESRKQLQEKGCIQQKAQPNDGEFAAFISYAQSFPDGFLALVDTYDTLNSGVLNFCAVALALHSLGHTAKGIRLDSGDLAYLSREARKKFRQVAEAFGIPAFAHTNIVASNDINEKVLQALNEEGHEVDTFGIGTHLVTCQAQPALGVVYKLVELNGDPRMKLSQDIEKTSVPSRKSLYRLYNKEGEPLMDILMKADAKAPQNGERIFARHLFDERKRCYVSPSRVEPLLVLAWDKGKRVMERKTIDEVRNFVESQMAIFRPDHLRLLNPTPYKVSASSAFYDFFRDEWQKTAPIYELM